MLHLPCWKSEQGHGKVPKRYRREYQHEQRGNSEEVKTKHEQSKRIPRKKGAISFKDFKRAYSIQIQAFLGVFCVRGIIILPMPLRRNREPQRATTTHSESDIIQAATYSRNTRKQVNIRLYQNRTNVQNQSREIIQPCWKYRGQAEQEQHQTSTDERAAVFSP